MSQSANVRIEICRCGKHIAEDREICAVYGKIHSEDCKFRYQHGDELLAWGGRQPPVTPEKQLSSSRWDIDMDPLILDGIDCTPKTKNQMTALKRNANQLLDWGIPNFGLSKYAQTQK